MLWEAGIESGIAAYLPGTLPGAGDLSEEQKGLKELCGDCSLWSGLLGVKENPKPKAVVVG